MTASQSERCRGAGEDAATGFYTLHYVGRVSVDCQIGHGV